MEPLAPKTPEQELAFLRETIARKEKAVATDAAIAPREAVTQEVVATYAEKAPADVLHPDMVMPQKEAEAIVLELAPETHDKKIEELVGIMYEKGIANTLTVVRGMNDPHISDDFHRFLVQYLKFGLRIVGLRESSPLGKTLKMTLYEISLPANVKDLSASMERFYLSLLTAGEEDPFTLELAVANETDGVLFYCGVPDEKKDMFNKQINVAFPGVKVREKKDDYNIFADQGVSVASVGKQARQHIFSIKTHDKFTTDPLVAIIASLSKIKKHGQGAAVQVVFQSVGELYMKKYKDALAEINRGRNLKETVDIPLSLSQSVFKDIKGIFKSSVKKPIDPMSIGPKIEDKPLIQSIENKISSPVMRVALRIVASAESADVAEAIRTDIESAFKQFDDAKGNGLVFEKMTKNGLKETLEAFSYRELTEDNVIPFSLKEIATIMHVPQVGI